MESLQDFLLDSIPDANKQKLIYSLNVPSLNSTLGVVFACGMKEKFTTPPDSLISFLRQSCLLPLVYSFLA